MAPRLSGRLLLVSAVLVVAVSGCGQGAATGDLDKVRIETSQFDVTVTNISGRALLEIRAEIFPAGRSTSYSVYAPRLENGEKQSFAFNRFSDRDAVPFSPRTVKAIAIAVSAKDIDGAPIHVEIPWK